MGTAFPRVLPRLSLRMAVTVVVALGFAPSAFAGVQIGAPVPVAVPTVTVPPAVTEAVTATSVPAVPATPTLPPGRIGLTAPTSPAAVGTSTPTVRPPRGPARRLPRGRLPRSSPKARGTRGPRVTLLASSRELTASRPPTIANRNMSTARPPQLPLPGPSDFSLPGGTALSAAFALLLFALAGELGLLVVPGLGRRLSLAELPPRPFAYLLELERPD
jgi:hypothetical protein